VFPHHKGGVLAHHWDLRFSAPMQSEPVSMSDATFLGASGHIHAGDTPPETNMTVEIPPFEDVLPIENGNFPVSC